MNKVIESSNFAFVSNGTKKKRGKNVPKSDGNFTVSSSLGFLAQQIIAAKNGTSQLKPGQDGSLLLQFAALKVDPTLTNKQGIKHRFDLYGFQVSPTAETIFVNGTITNGLVNQLLYQLLTILHPLDPQATFKNMLNSPQLAQAVQAAKQQTVLITGNYADHDALEEYSDTQMTLYLYYIQITADYRQPILQPYEFNSEEVTLKNQKQVKVFRLTDNGLNDGSISTLTTLKYLKDFHTAKYPAVSNTAFVPRNPKKGQKQFPVAQVTALNLRKADAKWCMQFPESVLDLFRKYNVTWLNFEVYFPGSQFTVNQQGQYLPRHNSIYEQIMQFNNNEPDRLIGMTGSLSLDDNKHSHIQIYTNQKQVTSAVIGITRPTFFTIKTLPEN